MNILNVIYDNRRTERYAPLINELKNQGVDYKIWDCIEDTGSVVRSINKSHKALVRYAKESELKRIIIGEDDLQFSAPGAWQYFLDNEPEQYDLYLWGSYLPLHSGMVCGFQLYSISEKFYDKFLSVPENKHIDTAMDDLKGDYHFCYPFVALQRPGYSANNKAYSDYNRELKPEDIFR